MTRNNLFHSLVGVGLSAMAAIAIADDTDIYMSAGGSMQPGSEPMVIFTLDYRPNLGSTACNGSECDQLIAEHFMPATGPYTFFDVLRGALKKVMEPLVGVRVGLILNHYSENNCAGPEKTGCSNGAYIAMGTELFQAGDANGAKAQFHRILAAIPPPASPGHLYQGKEAFFEMFRYLTGQGIYNGHNGWNDYNTDKAENLDVDGFRDADSDGEPDYFGWDTSVELGDRYISPLSAANECTDIFTINTMFLVSSQDDNSDSAIEAALNNGGFGTSVNGFTQAIQYLNDADLANGSIGTVPSLEGKQNVTSYFLVDPTKINKTTIGYARAGGTGAPLALSSDPGELVAALNEIFKQVLSVSTTFVAASVPVNVFNRAELLGSVYVGLFQVDGDTKPAWPGNVKKLKLSSIDGSSLLLDALDEPAVAGDGRIRFDALTLWTLPDSLRLPDEKAGEVAGRDGRFITRGGAGQRVPGYLSGGPGSENAVTGRRLFFDNGGSLAALNADEATAAVLQSDLGAADAPEALELLQYARGLDVDDIDSDGDTTEARGWIFGDPLHSQPLALNYGARGSYTEANPAVYIAAGSNDGFMRFIRNTTTSGTESGQEAWAFMPRSTMHIQKTLRVNGVDTKHPYGVDGAPTAYFDDTNNNGTIESGESAYLFFGLRRGGKAYYALDISDPENPELMWTIEKSGDFDELGYTFSRPRVGMMNAGNGPQPVLIFGGGYDLNKDTRSGVGTDDSEGTAIYIVDAKTKELIWKARGGGGAATSTVYEHPDLVDSIPSDVSVADSDGDLLLDRILVGDTGGNVWRADVGGSDTSKWKLTRLAALGRHAEADKVNDRRFFHRPDIVPAEDDDGIFDAVLIGSGDRPDPLDAGGVVANWFYMLKDRNTVSGAGTDVNLKPADLGDVTDNCIQEGSSCSADLTHGWKLQLESSGEKALATPITIAGSVFFTTYIPAGGAAVGSCEPAEGRGRLYAVSLQNASSVINYDTSVDPDETEVPDDGDDSDDGATTKSDRFTDLNAPGIPAEVVSVPPDKILRPDLQIDDLNVKTRWRTFWYLEEDSDL